MDSQTSPEATSHTAQRRRSGWCLARGFMKPVLVRGLKGVGLFLLFTGHWSLVTGHWSLVKPERMSWMEGLPLSE